MSKENALRSGGRILADALVGHGVDRAYCIPGESYLELMDGLYEHRSHFQLIPCRHEAGASFMAEAYGKLTGTPGVCIVTRGPGACNASIGVHTAYQDSTPMILLVGQVPRPMKDREAFQEVDFTQQFAPMTKWVAEIGSAERIPEYVSRAFHIAISGRPGPVVLALPEDVLREQADTDDLPRYAPTTSGEPDLSEFEKMLGQAAKPLLIVGGSGWTEKASADLTACAELWGVPVAAAFRHQDLIDNDDPFYVGHMGLGLNADLAKSIAEADLLIVAGARLGEATTQGYTLPKAPKPSQKLIHIHPSSDELNSLYRADLAICAGMPEFFAAAHQIDTQSTQNRLSWCSKLRANYEADQTAETADKASSAVSLAQVVAHLREVLPPEAIITNDAGNFATWLHRFYRWRQYGTQLAPTNGAMGYGVPSAIAAKHLHPNRPVVCMVGDGGFMMTGQEIATAIQFEIAPIILVVNNGIYGTIRMHQEKRFPNRVIATSMVNPDFTQLANAYGAFGQKVTQTDQFPAAFAAALKSDKVSVIELVTDPNVITSTTTINELRKKK